MSDPRPDDHRNPDWTAHDLKPNEFGVTVPIVEDEPDE